MVDSDEGENELAPFRNVMNEMYARDISAKSGVRTAYAGTWANRCRNRRTGT